MDTFVLILVIVVIVVLCIGILVIAISVSSIDTLAIQNQKTDSTIASEDKIRKKIELCFLKSFSSKFFFNKMMKLNHCCNKAL